MPGSGNHFHCNSEGLCGPTPMESLPLVLGSPGAREVDRQGLPAYDI